MKQLLLTVVALFYALIAMSATDGNSIKKSEIMPIQTENMAGDNEWILIGEITLSNYNISSETIIASLYVREMAGQLIYRVLYQGEYYATRWHDYSNTYHVTIKGKTYRCDVPARSQDTSSGNKTGLQRFVGIWKTTGTDFGDIQISIKEGKLFLQMKINDGVKSSYPRVSGDEIWWSFDDYEDYGEWHAQNTSQGHLVLGEGITWEDRLFVKEKNLLITRANREVFRLNYYAELKDGNLKITRGSSYLFFYNRELAFSHDVNFKSIATYTQW